MAFERVKIDGATISKAFDLAESGDKGRDIWADTEQRGLVLERRGKTVSWFVKTRAFTRRLGSAGRGYKGDHINPREARSTAASMLRDITAAPPKETVQAPERATCWTWAQMIDARLTNIAGDRMSGNRIRIPSDETQADVRSAFGIRLDADERRSFDPSARPRLSALQDIRLDDLGAADVMAAVRAQTSMSAQRKLLAYTKSALSWAASNDDKSGFRCSSPWWPPLRLPDLSPDKIAKKRAGDAALRSRKAKFCVDHVGQVLARHEAFCLSNNTSPGVRFGFWLACLTAGRRGATSALKRAGIEWSDELGKPEWGVAKWADAEMKGRQEFWLPAPPIVLRILWLALHDFEARRPVGSPDPTAFVFASLRRAPGRRRTIENADVGTNGYSFSTHIYSMRGIRKDGKHKIDVLDDIPSFSMHTVRTAATKFLGAAAGVPGAAASALLDHGEKGDGDEDMHLTTERYYNEGQRMPLKAVAMDAWTKAVMDAFTKAGGMLPDPCEHVRTIRETLPKRPF